MALFSERYGYVKPRDVLIKERITEEISNAICTAYDQLEGALNYIDVNSYRNHDESYTALELAIWIHFENNRQNDFYDFRGHKIVATEYVKSAFAWYKVLDMLEFSIKWMKSNYKDRERSEVFCKFVNYLNHRFTELGFAYRVVNCEIVEITSEEEIVAVEQALAVGDSISNHISTALKLLSQRPEGDYRNSIKESISAVEYVCREITGKITLGDSLKELEKKGIDLPPMLKVAFEKLYVYTNDKTTGIRHALMDEINTPGYDEAKFMLVACSSFVNYIMSKIK
ncbi:MAG: hypothetical protein J6R12_01475 [Bacteroidales bacterium]|nr:hypothetical protein [Bacteroidales bacterium]